MIDSSSCFLFPDFVKIFRIFRRRESLKINRPYLWSQIQRVRAVKKGAFRGGM